MSWSVVHSLSAADTILTLYKLTQAHQSINSFTWVFKELINNENLDHSINNSSSKPGLLCQNTRGYISHRVQCFPIQESGDIDKQRGAKRDTRRGVCCGQSEVSGFFG